jgi:hypothetical protein
MEPIPKQLKNIASAKAGVQNMLKNWIPAFVGMTTTDF